MSYSVITDPSGALLQDIDHLVYRDTRVELIPVYNQTYQLRNSVGKVVADKFYPFIPPSTFSTPNPYLTRDASNNIYVTKTDSSEVDGNTSNTVAILINNTFVNLNFKLPSTAFTYYPRGIAFDSNGNLYITTSVANNNEYINSSEYATSILYKVKFAPGSTIISIFNITGVSLNDLRGLSFDSSGNLYIADRLTNNIIKVEIIDSDNGVATMFLPNYTGLNGPLDIKFDQYNNAYIANSLENNIIKVTPSKEISIFATGLLYPTEITYNIDDSALYVANYGYSTNDKNITSISKIVNGIVSEVIRTSFPYGIVANTNGEIYYTSSSNYNDSNSVSLDVTNKLNLILYEYNSTNNASLYTSNGIEFSISPVSSITFDSTNTYIYAAQYNFIKQEIDTSPDSTGIIWKINNASPYTPVQFYPNNISDPSLNNPTSITFNVNYTYLYVANSASNNIIVINSIGTIGTIVDINGVQLSAPSAIVFDGNGMLYVANSTNNTICILDFPDNYYTANSVQYIFTGANILRPSGLVFDELYNLYVSNPGYNNVLKISNNVASVYNLNGIDIFSPTDLYFNNLSGILYVSDLDTGNIIQITNNNYATALYIVEGSSIIPPGILTIEEPMSIIMDNSNNLYVANYGNQIDSIIKLTPNTASTIIVNAGTLAQPTDATMQPTSNNIFICNFVSSIVSKLEESNNLSNFADVSKSSAESVASNIYTGRIYVLFTDGSIKSVSSLQSVADFQITGLQIGEGAKCIRYKHPSEKTATFVDFLYVADTSNNRILQISIDNPVNRGTSEELNITDYPTNFKPTSIAFGATIDTSNNMYISAGSNEDTTYNSKIVYVINILDPTLQATPYVEIPILSDNGIKSITFDSYGYMYALTDYNIAISQIYRTTPDALTTELAYTFPDTIFLNTINYIPWEDAILMTDTIHNKLYKMYLSYPFFNMQGRLGPYDDTLFIFNITNNINEFDVSFNIYNPYVVIDPSNITPNLLTYSNVNVNVNANANANANFRFVIPNVVPEPTDSYLLLCNDTSVSNVFCNNCTYNKQKFLAGTYPTGLVYSTSSNYLYVALQNNTISRVSPLGIVDNSYFPSELGLVGPTSLVLDTLFNMYILNVGGGFISFLTLENNIISINNDFYTGIYYPICLTYDAETNSLYLLSGKVPNTRITRIDAATGNGQILPIAFGNLYDPNGLTIDAYYGLFSPIDEQPPNTKYLYVSNTNQNGVHSILRVNLTTGLYEISTLISGLEYKPFTMTNQNDGFLYVANKNNNSISKISITGLDSNIQPWAINGISVPVDICFDSSGNLYIANAGTTPRNSRISKISTEDFFFTNITLTNGTCDNAKIYDITTQSYVELDYYPAPNNYIFPIPIPYPIGS